MLEATGSVLTNKYAEGYPGRRYYGGCEVVDVVEDLAIARAKELFGAEHVNVQPHSGAQANMAVYFTLLKPGDVVLGPNLSHGGHLTAGSPVNYSGKFYSIVAYGVRRDTERIDLDQVRDLAKEHRPKLLIAGGSAFPRAIDFQPFADIAREVGATLMADIAHPAGLVAAGLHPSPVGLADFVTTTTHKTLRGPRGGMVMCRASHAAALDKTVMPGVQGGPLMHVIAAKAVALREALTPEWRAYQQQIVTNAARLRRGPAGPGLPAGDRRHRHASAAGRPDVARDHRQGRAGGARPGLDHREQEHGAVRDQEPDGDERHPAGDAGGDDAGHEDAGDGHHRRADRPRAVEPRLGDGRGHGARRGAGADGAASRSIRTACGERPRQRRWGPMKCPFCGHTEDRVVDSRVGRDGEFIRRRRECLKCHRRYTTYEYIEDVLPHVEKRDGRREPFDRQKLRHSILKACEKRSVAVNKVDDIVAEIEQQLHERAEKEIKWDELGEMVMEQLKKLDQVAYVRFSSVYRQFQDVSQFSDTVAQLKGLLKDDKPKPVGAPPRPRPLSRTK